MRAVSAHAFKSEEPFAYFYVTNLVGKLLRGMLDVAT
jgi:hypothetical protein